MKRIIIIYVLISLCYTSYAREQWSLRDCIEHVIENNLEIRKQEIVKKQQEIELNTAKFSRLPNLNGSASQSFNFGRGLNSENTYVDRNTQNTSFNLSTDIPLFTGFQIPNNIALGKLNLQAATEDLNKAKEDISINVMSYFLQVLFNQELHKVALEQVTLSKEQYDRIKRLHEVGKAAVSDVYEAKARAAQDELSATETANNVQLSLLNLSQLLELPSPEGFEIYVPENSTDIPVLTNPEEIYNEAVTGRPGILAAQYRLKGAEKSINIAQSAYYPKLSIGAGLGSSYYRLSGIDNASFGKQLDLNLSKYVGFNLSIPIFNRFETRNRVRTARLQQSNQSIYLEDSKKALYKEIQQAYYKAVAAESKYRASESTMEANEAAFRLASEKYENGKATSLEYNEMKINLMKSISDRIQAKYDYLFSVKILDFYKGVPLTL